MQVIIEENRMVKKFFRNNQRHEQMIRDHIQQKLPMIIVEKGYKIKMVVGYQYQGQTIYEYKIPLDANSDCRVAYVASKERIVAFFISNTVVKREFTKLLIKMHGVMVQ